MRMSEVSGMRWMPVGGKMAVSHNLDKVLMKKYEEMGLDELVTAPVTALAGVTESDAKHLLDAFNIKTVGDLARNKYFKAASAILALSEAGK
jgi:hypothetical protein